VPPSHRNELFSRKYDHAILDCGVTRFEKETDYPHWFNQNWVSLAHWTCERTRGKTWIVIPDYPDDVGRVGILGDNVKRTLENVKWFSRVDSVPWLVPLQSRYKNHDSFIESCAGTREIVGAYPRIAIGSVCKMRSVPFIVECCKTAREYFPKSWIHAFGLTLSALPKVWNVIDSFDSLAYNYPGMSFDKWKELTGLPPRPSCGRGKLSEPWFDNYMSRLNVIEMKMSMKNGVA